MEDALYGPQRDMVNQTQVHGRAESVAGAGTALQTLNLLADGTLRVSPLCWSSPRKPADFAGRRAETHSLTNSSNDGTK